MWLFVYAFVLYVATSITLFPMFERAGEAGWKALVPGYNFMIWQKLLGQAQWKALYMLVPLVNIFAFAYMCMDLTRAFGFMKFRHSVLATIMPPLMFLWIGKEKTATFEADIVPRQDKYTKDVHEAHAKKDAKAKLALAKSVFVKPAWREWTESIVFAVFAASFIRMFFIEAYVIPSSSMEGSLKVGDYLFVSKAHYGVRTPQTVFQVPLLHNRLPFIEGESYFSRPNVNYHRFVPMQRIERNDPVVFNYPEGDSVFITPGRTVSIYDVRNDTRYAAVPSTFPLVVRPVDKADHYIKRCLGVAGDTLQIKNKQILINNKPSLEPSNVQFRYQVLTGGASLDPARLEELGVSLLDCGPMAQSGYFNLNKEQVRAIEGFGGGIQVQPDTSTNMVQFYGGVLFPRDKVNFNSWTLDNFGPIVIPSRGMKMDVTPQNIALYRRAIAIYEGNKLEERNGQIFINAQLATSYTFKLDYFWMMGDNRHNSEDSRFWGFVPETHVVGKPLFLFFSTKNGRMTDGINTDRIFTSANKM